jgi:hypothetical protein
MFIISLKVKIRKKKYEEKKQNDSNNSDQTASRY